MNILLTGSTGHIGQQMVRKLHKEGHRLYLLVRPQSLNKAMSQFSDLSDLTFIQGDIEESDVVKNIYTVSAHLDVIECIVHLAAFYELKATLKEAYLKNVIGTQNIIRLMSKMKSIKFFHYFSTYAVNPIAQGHVSEDFLASEGVIFSDEYSRTKNHAEHIVRKNKLPNVKTIIHRPGIIIGDSQTGAILNTNGPYYLFDFIQMLKKVSILSRRIPFLPMPVKTHSVLPILPVDILTDWVTHIISNPPKEDFRCYHLIPSDEIKTKAFLEESMQQLGLPLKILGLSQTQFIAPLLPMLNIPRETAFYMSQEAKLDRSNLVADYPQLTSPHFREYLPKVIQGYLRSKA